MKVTIMLADHAQAFNNKLFILGGGLSTVQIGVPFAIALLIEVPWDQANEKHNFVLRLIDEDGNAVLLPGPAEPSPVEVGMAFEVGRPPGTKKGSRLPFTLALNFAPMSLIPDKIYVWSLTIDEEKSKDWELAFAAVGPAVSPV
jgi:hypothetical protein